MLRLNFNNPAAKGQKPLGSITARFLTFTDCYIAKSLCVPIYISDWVKELCGVILASLST